MLIPSFNNDLRPLIGELFRQCTEANITFEILAADDASQLYIPNPIAHINASLNQSDNIKFLQLQDNLGRSQIRNYLASLARYPWLLFLDGDVMVNNPMFIKNYLHTIPHHPCVYGSCSYPPIKPARPFLLHWKYGREIESAPMSARLREPHLHFRSVNFLCSRDLITRIPFPNAIRSYGFEDTAWANDLKRQDISMLPIDNPVIHYGLDPCEQFLQKKDEALKNLVSLENQQIHLNTRLQRWYFQYRRARWMPAFECLCRRIEKPVRSLLNHLPSLLLFRIFQLARYFHWKSALSEK